jgi:hypothetical protein
MERGVPPSRKTIGNRSARRSTRKFRMAGAYFTVELPRTTYGPIGQEDVRYPYAFYPGYWGPGVGFYGGIVYGEAHVVERLQAARTRVAKRETPADAAVNAGNGKGSSSTE